MPEEDETAIAKGEGSSPKVVGKGGGSSPNAVGKGCGWSLAEDDVGKGAGSSPKVVRKGESSPKVAWKGCASSLAEEDETVVMKGAGSSPKVAGKGGGSSPNAVGKGCGWSLAEDDVGKGAGSFSKLVGKDGGSSPKDVGKGAGWSSKAAAKGLGPSSSTWQDEEAAERAAGTSEAALPLPLPLSSPRGASDGAPLPQAAPAPSSKASNEAPGAPTASAVAGNEGPPKGSSSAAAAAVPVGCGADEAEARGAAKEAALLSSLKDISLPSGSSKTASSAQETDRRGEAFAGALDPPLTPLPKSPEAPSDEPAAACGMDIGNEEKPTVSPRQSDTSAYLPSLRFPVPGTRIISAGAQRYHPGRPNSKGAARSGNGSTQHQGLWWGRRGLKGVGKVISRERAEGRRRTKGPHAHRIHRELFVGLARAVELECVKVAGCSDRSDSSGDSSSSYSLP